MLKPNLNYTQLSHLGMPTAVVKPHRRARKSEAPGSFLLVRKECDCEGLQEGQIFGAGPTLVLDLSGGFMYSLYNYLL